MTLFSCYFIPLLHFSIALFLLSFFMKVANLLVHKNTEMKSIWSWKFLIKKYPCKDKCGHQCIALLALHTENILWHDCRSSRLYSLVGSLLSSFKSAHILHRALGLISSILTRFHVCSLLFICPLPMSEGMKFAFMFFLAWPFPIVLWIHRIHTPTLSWWNHHG